MFFADYRARKQAEKRKKEYMARVYPPGYSTEPKRQPNPEYKLQTTKEELIQCLITYDHMEREDAELHVEVDDNGKLVGLEGGEEVCTHIKDKDLKEELEKQAQEELKKKKQDAQRRIQDEIERRLEEMLNKWFKENCGGC